MRLVSLNIGLPKVVEHRGRQVSTGIYKNPTRERLWVRRTNIDGDRQADLRVHGGVDKAVYAYPIEHYAYWSEVLGRDALPLGQFGENLTVEGMLEEQVQIGDVFRIGATRLEVSQPRSPCYKLGIKMGDEDFPRRFTESGRIGFYLRVLTEGTVAAGDTIERVERGAGGMSVLEVFRLRFDEQPASDRLSAAAAVPALAETWRRALARRQAGV